MKGAAGHGLPSWLILIGAMTAVGPVSIDMYLPGFPAIEREFAERGVERTMAAYLIGIALGQLFYGPLSDRFGRKPPLYAGFALYAIGSLGCALAGSMTMLMAMRILQALGACGGLVIGRAIVRDRCEPQDAGRAFSTLMAIVALGPVLAPMAGGWVVVSLGWRAVFVFQCVLGVALMIAMHIVLKESRDPASVAPLRVSNVARSYAKLAADRTFLGFILAGGFGMGAMFAYVAGAPTVLMQVYDLSPRQFGMLIGLNGFAFLAASRINLRSLHKRSPIEVLSSAIWIPALFGGALTLTNVFWTSPLWLVVALQFAFFVSVARVGPNVAAMGLAPHGREAGTASALMGALQSGVATAAGVAVAIFNDGSVRTLAVIMTIGALCSWLSYSWARRQQ